MAVSLKVSYYKHIPLTECYATLIGQALKFSLPKVLQARFPCTKFYLNLYRLMNCTQQCQFEKAIGLLSSSFFFFFYQVPHMNSDHCQRLGGLLDRQIIGFQHPVNHDGYIRAMAGC